MMHLMGEPNRQGLRLDFNRRRKLEFHGFKVTSDVGLLAYQELDDVPDRPRVGRIFQGNRTGKIGCHGMTGLFNQSALGRLGSYENVNDASGEGRPSSGKRKDKRRYIQAGACNTKRALHKMANQICQNLP